MTILDVTLVWARESFDDDDEFNRTYVHGYRVLTDDPLQSATSIRLHPDIPAPRAPHPDDPAAIVSQRNFDRLENSRCIWEGTVTYTFKSKDPDKDGTGPLERPALIRWTGSLESLPVVKDLDGKAIVNKAGDYFDPPPEGKFPRAIANIQFNLAVVPIDILSYVGAVNSVACLIDGVPVAAGRAQVVAMDISEWNEEDEERFRSITLGVECRDPSDEGFDLSLLNQGFRIKVAGVQKDIIITDEDGNQARPSAPVLLDGSGGKLADPSPETAVFLPFNITRKVDLTIFPGIDPV